MAIDIASQVRAHVTKLSDLLDLLNCLQAVSADCHHVEDLQDLWMLRADLMARFSAEWEPFTEILFAEFLPLVVQLSGGDHA